MIKKKYRPVDSKRGKGKLFKEGKVFAEVLYHLRITQEFLIQDDEEIPGQVAINGEITVSEEDGRNIEVLQNISGNSFTLQTNDDREVDIIVLGPISPLNRTCKIKGTGPDEFVSEYIPD
jgi:hypothetical protein